MISGFNIAYTVLTTLSMVTRTLGLQALSLIICTDFLSLYECIAKFGSTTEKRLMIDIMGLRQSYEPKEITEIPLINGDDNPADALTKGTPKNAIQNFIDTNELVIRAKGYVDRPEDTAKVFWTFMSNHTRNGKEVEDVNEEDESTEGRSNVEDDGWKRTPWPAKGLLDCFGPQSPHSLIGSISLYYEWLKVDCNSPFRFEVSDNCQSTKEKIAGVCLST